MKVTKKQITIGDLYEGFVDEGEDGVLGYDERLNIRPPYQRELVYSPEQQQAVIHSVMHGFPINVMYWVKNNDPNSNDDAEYELLDGQQRTMSICRFVDGAYTIKRDGKPMGFYNLSKVEQQQILDYPLDIYVCDGTDRERLEWFEVINTAGEKLTPQELRNATYMGKWCSDAKRIFSKTNGYAVNLGGRYVKGVPIRQEIFEKVLKWAAEADGITGSDAIEQYMAKHQHDEDANALKKYFTDVIEWVAKMFPDYESSMKGIDWGHLYNKYHGRTYNRDSIKKDVARLMGDPDVTKKSGIYEYVLAGGRDSGLENLLSIRQFDDVVKRAKYEDQGHKCAICGKDIKRFKDARADHIIPWIDGGTTTLDNCQILCERCNIAKSSKHI